MKVFIITNDSFPYGMASTKRIICYAKSLLSTGVECEVVVFTRTERYGLKPQNTLGKGIFEGIHFRYTGGTPLRGRNVFIRKLNDYLDRLRLKRYLKTSLHSGDVVLGYAIAYVHFINSVIRLVHRLGAKFVKDLCELPYGTLEETDKAIRNRQITLTKQFPLCDGIICISDALYNLARQYVSKKCKLIKVPILVDYEAYELEDKSDEAKYPYIFHSGTLYEQKDGILGMIEAFGIAIPKTKVPLRFISTGNMEKSPHADDIRNLIKKYHLEDRLTFTGYLSEEKLKEYLSYASLVIINKYNTQQNKYCFSTKLAEYLSAKKPLIITNVGEAMNWLENKKSAYIVETGNTQLLASAIVELMENPEERQRIAQNGNTLCRKNFDYRCYGEKLKHFLLSCHTLE